MAGMIPAILTGLLRGVRTQRALVLENLALRHQLAVLQRTAARPRLRTSDRLFWVLLSRLWSGWADALSFVQPATVTRASSERSASLALVVGDDGQRLRLPQRSCGRRLHVADRYLPAQMTIAARAVRVSLSTGSSVAPKLVLLSEGNMWVFSVPGPLVEA
jgi:hypothetical protein